MRYLVFGSLNIDRTYTVEHFVSPGETLAAESMALYCGGKGFNQAVALSRAGARVAFAGAVGEDGGMLVEALESEGIDTQRLRRLPGATGHAVIQVDKEGRNCILILAGTNGQIGEEDVKKALSGFGPGDAVVLQNEITCVDRILMEARQRGMTVVLNPSPCDRRALSYDLSLVDILLINEGEGLTVANVEREEDILRTLRGRYPGLQVVLTLGERGAVYMDAHGDVVRCGAYRVRAVDTTAAGDTFTGYFLSQLLESGDSRRALLLASVASGIAVSRRGASASIPGLREVLEAAQSAEVDDVV